MAKTTDSPKSRNGYTDTSADGDHHIANGFDNSNADELSSLLQRRPSSSINQPTSYAGIAITVLTSLTYATVVTIGKHIYNTYNVPLGEMLILLVGFQALPAFLGLLIRRSASQLVNPVLLRKHGWRLIAQGSCGALVNLLQFTAITTMQMGNAAVVFCTSPVFVAFISLLFLKERITLVKSACILATIVGCVLITRSESALVASTTSQHVRFPDEDLPEAHSSWTFLYALTAAVLQATSLVVLRALRHVDPFVIITYYGTIGAVAYLIWAGIIFRHELVVPFVGDQPGSTVWPWLLLLAATMNGSANMALAHACRRENASVVGLVSTLEVVFVFVYQVAFFKEVPGWMSIAGTLLVLACVVVIGVEKGVVATAPATAATPASEIHGDGNCDDSVNSAGNSITITNGSRVVKRNVTNGLHEIP